MEPSAALTAADVMSSRPWSVGLDDSLAQVHALFVEHHIHHLLVVEDRVLVGIVSDRDLWRALSPTLGTAAETPKDAATLTKRVHQVMSRRPVTARRDTPLREVARILQSHEFSCVPVVNEEDHPIGIISWRDVLGALLPDDAEPSTS